MTLRILASFLLVVVTSCNALRAESTRLAATEDRCSPTGADAIYVNGTVITMNDTLPLAEAVAVQDGRVLAVGAIDTITRLIACHTHRIDLRGKTLLPGFVDSHGHAHMIGLQALAANLLPPPDGDGSDIARLQNVLREWLRANPETLERIGWVVGFGYDDSQLAERRHPTRQDLDAVTTDYPVLIIHQSGHLAVANSAALALAGISAETSNPAGGVIRREVDSDIPNGVLEEHAALGLFYQLFSRFDDAMNEQLVLAGTELAASYGYTTVQDGRSTTAGIAAMQRVAKSGALQVDLVAYPDILDVKDIAPSRNYHQRFRVGGAKLSIDGSPQGKTAYLSQPYHVPPSGQTPDYRGYPALDEKRIFAAVADAFAKGWQLLSHANGDAAIDTLIAAVSAARSDYPDADTRPVLIHGQTLREDQVDQLQALGIFPSLFPMHTFYWGDWHRESVLGAERAENISPTGWLLERGMRFGTHHDAPVALPNAMRVLSATVTRRTRSGYVLGPQHRVPVAVALKAMTLWPAWQHFEEQDKGSIAPGKLADFVILSDNPLKVPESELADLQVLETIKEGRSVYRQTEELGTTSAAKSY
jgi:predicted amidohydrolase YtcJ